MFTFYSVFLFFCFQRSPCLHVPGTGVAKKADREDGRGNAALNTLPLFTLNEDIFLQRPVGVSSPLPQLNTPTGILEEGERRENTCTEDKKWAAPGAGLEVEDAGSTHPGPSCPGHTLSGLQAQRQRKGAQRKEGIGCPSGLSGGGEGKGPSLRKHPCIRSRPQSLPTSWQSYSLLSL